MTALLWLTRDLRVHDHPALCAALEQSDDVVPVFCFDSRLLNGRHASRTRTRFMLECLAELDERLGGIAFRDGRPERVLPELARELGARAVHATEDVGPFARRRAEAVRRALSCPLVLHPGVAAVDGVASIRTQAGRPYTVFSPFERTWLEEPRRVVLEAPDWRAELPAGLRGELPPAPGGDVLTDPPRGGEDAGRLRLQGFIDSGIEGYAERRDDLGADATSRLSPYLHFGCVSAREVEERLPSGEGARAFRRQLCWRDFHGHVLLHFPRNARSEFQERYRGSIRWSRSRRRFDAWCEGRTGFPLVDAAMRQLRTEGWVHNRARLVAASFLTKQLGIDWRQGERWFMRWLVDGDQANNNGNWQWVSSVGVDPQPFYRRLYNPTRQLRTLDPDGVYVRRHVEELREVPLEHLAEPWANGVDYPEPIVDQGEAREAAIARFVQESR
ncbi:MAG TPA: deoxyribodipyrimidine photo-lyase [Thermoleophilaceae bacterium]